ncbi:protein LLP homolog [Galendromus occidentalis]|uniref:Protein LLP homolog n=1 Tax=Galendromus occidentalis TaxID=34638 RepID=A0AAJ6QYK4_9ACAR|nr:protein LLP homolog [Galendromus occidentalis]
MAKSIRSKRGKKMRAIKRIRYDDKAVKKLRETVKKGVTRVVEEGMDIEQAGGVLVDYLEKKKQALLKRQEENMEEGEAKVFNKRMQDENGQYPVWMGKKQQRKTKHKTKKNRKSNGRKDSW